MQTRNTVKVSDAFTKVRMLVAQGSDQRNRGLTGQNMRLSHRFGPQGRGKMVYLPHGARYCFHAYKSVAPLKHVVQDDAQPHDRVFPRLQKRGPIEALDRALETPPELCFHAYKSVAPLKPGRSRCNLAHH